MKIAELTDWQDSRERFKQWPTLAGFPESMRTSSDGLVRIDFSAYECLCRQPAATPSLCNGYACVQHHFWPPAYIDTVIFARVVLASPKEAGVSLRLIDELPPPDDTTLWCISLSKFIYANARCMLGEVLEQEGRFREAVEWARAEIQVRQRGRHLALSAE